MDFTQIKSQLQKALLIDGHIETIFEEFCILSGSEDIPFFIEYLYKNNLIDETTFRSLDRQQQVIVFSDFELQEEQTFFQNDSDSALQEEFMTVVSNNQSDTSLNETPHQSPQENISLLGVIGEGAMGQIHLAREESLQRKIAFKTLHQQHYNNQEFLKRFYNEAQITAQLDHPNIVPIYGLEHTEQGLGCSMKFIQGKTLKQLLKETSQFVQEGKPVPPEYSLQNFLHHFLKLCDALEFAHTRGVLHRDLKPENIMIGPYNEVYLMDWGIARIISSDSKEVQNEVDYLNSIEKLSTQSIETSELSLNMTAHDSLIGTPRYMSPEQIKSSPESLTEHSDIYAMGIILFEIVTLKRAIKAESVKEVLNKTLNGHLEVAAPYSSSIKSAHELQAIIKKATALEVEDRYKNIREMADDIRNYLSGKVVSVHRDTQLQSLLRWISQHRQKTLMLFMGMLVLSFATISWTVIQRYQDKIKSQIQKEKLSEFLMSTATKSHEINNHFLYIESLVESLASATTSLLEYKNTNNDPYFMVHDYIDQQKQPPDLIYSPIYRFPISIDWGAFRLPPGAKKANFNSRLQQLAPLSFYLKQIFIKSPGPETVSLSRKKVAHMISTEGLPLIWANVGFEGGHFIGYPGNGAAVNKKYDPRKRPWYKHSKNKRGRQWLAPYVDSQGQGIILPCTRPIYSKQNQFLGVANVSMSLNYLVKNLLSINHLHGIKDAYLLNEKGEIVIQASNQLKRHKLGTLINKFKKLQPFPNSDIIQMIQQGKRNSFLEVKKGKRTKALAFQYLSAPGWYYLVEAQPTTSEF